MQPQDLAFADTAPISVSVSRDLPVDAKRVFAVLSDHRGWPAWVKSGVTSVEPTSDPESGVGATRTVTFFGKRTIEERFVAWEEPTLWAFTGTGGTLGVFSKLVERFTIEVTSDGSRVTYTMGTELAPIFRGLTPVFGIAVRAGARGILRRLERAALA